MTITITGAAYAPLWETTQAAIVQALGVEDGRLTRISRPDGQCNYRAKGVYVLEFIPLPTGDAVQVQLEVI
jgi:hypothetical protein